MNYIENIKKKFQLNQACNKKISEERKKNLIVKGLPVFQKFNIHKAILFGSIIDNKSTEASDIDLLVIPISGKNYWDFRYELEEAVSCPVDLYTQSDDPKFIKKIMDRGETIYEV